MASVTNEVSHEAATSQPTTLGYPLSERFASSRFGAIFFTMLILLKLLVAIAFGLIVLALL